MVGQEDDTWVSRREKENKSWEPDYCKLGRVQNSMRCGNCCQEGHNIRSCKSHLLSKNVVVASTKRKKASEPSQTQENSEKRACSSTRMTPNELRQKVKEKMYIYRKRLLIELKMVGEINHRGRPSNKHQSSVSVATHVTSTSNDTPTAHLSDATSTPHATCAATSSRASLLTSMTPQRFK